jgi:hypothetical protein
LNKFFDSADLDKYFACYYAQSFGTGYKHQTGRWALRTVPKWAETSQYNYYMVPNDETDWLDMMEKTYGVDGSWVVPDKEAIAGPPCSPKLTSQNFCNHRGQLFSYKLGDNINIPNPAEAIKSNLGSYSEIADGDAAFLNSILSFEGKISDVVEGASIERVQRFCIYNGQKECGDVGKMEEQKEAAANRLMIIETFVRAILMFLPGISEELQ